MCFHFFPTLFEIDFPSQPHLKTITSKCYDVLCSKEEMEILQKVIKNLKSSAPNLTKVILDVDEDCHREYENWDSMEQLKNNLGLLLKSFHLIHQMFEENGISVDILGMKLHVPFFADEVTEAQVWEWNRSKIEFPFVFGSLKFNSKCSFKRHHEEEDDFGGAYTYLGVKANVQVFQN